MKKEIIEGLKKKLEDGLEETNAKVEVEGDCFVISFDRKPKKEGK